MGVKDRVRQIIEKLKETYPNAHTELDFKTPLQLLVATILSAQCTDKRVNLVTPGIFRDYPTAQDLAAVSQEELEETIKSTGFYRSKAKNLRAMAKILVEKFGGEVPRRMEDLTQLPGVGRKTANVVLGNAFSLVEGIVVDTHVARLARRFMLTKSEDPARIETDLMRLVPKTYWTDFSHWLIWHGRRRCYARNPDCLDCELGTMCPSYGKFIKSARGSQSKAAVKLKPSLTQRDWNKT